MIKIMDIPNKHSYIKFDGENKEYAFIFLHGYGTTYTDLLDLAKAINKRGYSCYLLILKGFVSDSEKSEKFSYEDWLQSLQNLHSKIKKDGKKIILIGFSLGATVAIDVAQNNEVFGIVGISTFLGMKNTRIVKSLIKLLQLLHIHYIPRKLITTEGKILKTINHSKYLHTATSKQVYEEAEKLTKKLNSLPSKCLFIHSVNDKLSSYNNLVKLLNYHHSNNALTVIFHKLNHFIQYDICPNSLGELIFEYFELNGANKKSHSVIPMRDSYTQLNHQLRQWKTIVFQIIVTFFTVFGGLVYFSLDKILQVERSGLYFLMAYSMVCSIYVILVSMYYFFLNRTLIHIKTYLEPNVGSVGPISHRTNTYIAGITSTKIAKHTSIVSTGIPVGISLVSLAYVIILYWESLTKFEQESSFVQLLFITASIIFAVSIKSLVRLLRYINCQLYGAPPTIETNARTQKAIINLSNTICPGRGIKNADVGKNY